MRDYTHIHFEGDPSTIFEFEDLEVDPWAISRKVNLGVSYSKIPFYGLFAWGRTCCCFIRG